jgi:lipoate-protein ligase A
MLYVEISETHSLEMNYCLLCLKLLQMLGPVLDKSVWWVDYKVNDQKISGNGQKISPNIEMAINPTQNSVKPYSR